MSVSRLWAALGLGPGWTRFRPWLLGLVLLALVNLAVLFALTLPMWKAARASGAAARVSQQAQEIIEPALQRARHVYGRVREADQELAELRRRVAGRSGSVSEVVSTLRAAVDAAGLRAERISYEAQPLEGLGLTQLQITLPVRGRYAQLRTFLDALLGGPIFAVVERIGASTPSSSDASGQLLMNVVLSAFVDGELTAPARPSSGAGSGQVAAEAPVTAGTDPVSLARSLRQRLAGLPEIPLPDEAFDVRLGRLEEEPDTAESSSRDLFAFANLPQATQERPTRERQVQPRPEPPQPVNPYDLLGVVRTGQGLVATIADDDRVYNVVEGDRLPAGYRVVQIGLVDVWLQAGRREIRLSLRKEKDETLVRTAPTVTKEAGPGHRTKKKKKKQQG